MLISGKRWDHLLLFGLFDSGCSTGEKASLIKCEVRSVVGKLPQCEPLMANWSHSQWTATPQMKKYLLVFTRFLIFCLWEPQINQDHFNNRAGESMLVSAFSLGSCPQCWFGASRAGSLFLSSRSWRFYIVLGLVYAFACYHAGKSSALLNVSVFTMCTIRGYCQDSILPVTRHQSWALLNSCKLLGNPWDDADVICTTKC